jgi:hypothetical protein
LERIFGSLWYLYLTENGCSTIIDFSWFETQLRDERINERVGNTLRWGSHLYQCIGSRVDTRSRISIFAQPFQLLPFSSLFTLNFCDQYFMIIFFLV